MRIFVSLLLIISLITPLTVVRAESADLGQNSTGFPESFESNQNAEEPENPETTPQDILLLVVFDDGSAALLLVSSGEGIVSSGAVVQVLEKEGKRFRTLL